MTLRDALAGALRATMTDETSTYLDWAQDILADPDFRAALVTAVRNALVEVEDSKIDWRHFENDDWEPGSLCCGDAEAVVEHLLGEKKTPLPCVPPKTEINTFTVACTCVHEDHGRRVRQTAPCLVHDVQVTYTLGTA